MPTPENIVKAKVKGLLTYHGAYFFMPVQTGFGQTSLDFIGCHHGLFFAIETKAAGKKMTTRQLLTAETMLDAGAAVFLIDGTLNDDYDQLVLFLESRPDEHPRQSRTPTRSRSFPGRHRQPVS